MILPYFFTGGYIDNEGRKVKVSGHYELTFIDLDGQKYLIPSEDLISSKFPKSIALYSDNIKNKVTNKPVELDKRKIILSHVSRILRRYKFHVEIIGL